MNFLSSNSPSEPLDYISTNWFRILIISNILALSGGFLVVQVTGRGITGDSALFHLGGWHLANGGTPYVDFWDINPPLPFVIAAILSLPIRLLPIQNEMRVLLYLGHAVSAAAVLSASLLTGRIAYRVFNDRLASLTAGLSIYLLPSLFILPATGIRPKYFLLAFGMASLYSYLREWPWVSGAFAALACTAHQAGLLYLLLAIGVTLYRDDLVEAGKVIGAAAGVAVVVLLPFVYWGAFTSMIVQTVFVSFLVDAGSASWTYHLVTLAEVLGYSLVVVPVASVGWWKLASRSNPETIWIPLGAGMFLAYNLFLDMNGSPDVWMFVVFIALGLAAVVAEVDRENGVLILAGIGMIGFAMLVLAYPNSSPPLYGVFDYLYTLVPAPEPLQANPPSDLPSMTERHWDQSVGDTCHWRLSDTELGWIEQTDSDYHESTCNESFSSIRGSD